MKIPPAEKYQGHKTYNIPPWWEPRAIKGSVFLSGKWVRTQLHGFSVVGACTQLGDLVSAFLGYSIPFFPQASPDYKQFNVS